MEPRLNPQIPESKYTMQNDLIKPVGINEDISDMLTYYSSRKETKNLETNGLS